MVVSRGEVSLVLEFIHGITGYIGLHLSILSIVAIRRYFIY